MKRLHPVRDGLKQLVKEKASERILALLPFWKQNNLQARATELLDMRINALMATTEIEDPLSPEEAAELTAIKEAWQANVQTIREYSDTLETEIDSGQQVDIDAGWPS